MKPIIPILALISAFWIFGGAYYLANTSCGTTVSSIAPLSISDGELDFNTTSNQHFSFLPSGHKIAIEEEAGKSFNAVAAHLAAHPDRQLTLNGWYTAEEENGSDYENLGIARAEEVKSFLVNMDSSIINRIFSAGEQKGSIYTINEKQIDGVEFLFADLEGSQSSIEEITEDAPVEETITSSAGLGVPTFSLFGKEEIKGISMDINLQQQIDNMKSAMELNPGAYIMVTGHSEKLRSESKSNDIAYIWASNVRRFFRNNGIKSKQIKASSKGATEPLVDADDAEASNKNNRVTVEVLMPE